MTSPRQHFEYAIIGSGVVGLSTAYALSAESRDVVVVDAPRAQHQASWAAAGMIPPERLDFGTNDFEALRALSRQTLAGWCEDIAAMTGIDPEFERSGSIHLARTFGEKAA